MWRSFWYALATCLQPRLLMWSLLPLVVAGGAVGLLGWAFWEDALDAVRAVVDAWSLSQSVFQWLHSVGAPQLRAFVAPLVVVVLAVPLVLVLSLLLVAVLATPAVVTVVAARHHPRLQARRGASWWQGLLWSLSCTLAALAALILSLPLWLVPPLVMVLPPLIWGWLTCRVLGFEVLAHHATPEERRLVLRGRRWTLLAIGLLCGYLSALPALLWTLGSAALLLAPLLMLVAVWMYTAIFMFAACWFAHFCLGDLQRLRDAETAERAEGAAVSADPAPQLESA